jgi:8-amino-7-oxononanoate synthase
MPRLPIESSTPTSVTLHGRELLAFAGCNYLGLGTHPTVIDALARAARTLGLSTTASRETTGNSLSHEALEAELARFMGLPGAILSAEGYTANFIAMQALSRDHRVAIIDAHAHRSLRHAAVASSMQVFDFEHLSAQSARWLIRQFGDQGVAVITDSVFAADGAVAPIRELLTVLPPHRATLVVDDCHGLCVLGPKGKGALASTAITDPRVVVTTTLAKGLGCYGGAVLGSRAFIDACQQHAWVYRSSTPLPPALAEACRAALRVLEGSDELVARLRRNVDLTRKALYPLGINLPPEGVPIFTFAISPEDRMQDVHDALMDEGVFAPLIEYPGGPAPRYFRVVVNAQHTPEQIARLGTLLARAMQATLPTTHADPARPPRPAPLIEAKPAPVMKA